MRMKPEQSCIGCGSEDVYRSRRRPVDHVLSWGNLYPYRCAGCGARFHRFGRRIALRAVGTRREEGAQSAISLEE